jgi:processive 1,2-diacylglycerol beta-glucosyltransferase
MISALFISCSNAGVAFWRMQSFVSAAHRVKAGFFLMPWWDKSLTSTHPWEVDLEDPLYKRRIHDELWDHAQKADVIVFQMVHTPAALETIRGLQSALSRCRCGHFMGHHQNESGPCGGEGCRCSGAVFKSRTPIVSEIDDNILSTPTYNPADSVYQPGSMFRSIAVEQFKMSDAMVVSTPYLQEVYGEFCENIQVVPNSLDFRIWDNLKHRRNTDLVRIGWAGGASHEDDLRIIEPVVRKTLEAHRNVRFCFVHGIPEFFKDVERIEAFHQFTRIDRYPQFLASRGFDIGLAPLVDNAFNRAKSNLRWLEYAGLKVPCVASNVGHFAETIRNGVDGVLCSDEYEWTSALNDLILNPVTRKSIGTAANRRARKDFNVDSTVHHYAKILQEIVDKGPVVKIDNPEIIPGGIIEEKKFEGMGAQA